MRPIKTFILAAFAATSLLALGCGNADDDTVIARQPLRLSDGTVIQPLQPTGNYVIGPIYIPAFDGCAAGGFYGSLSINQLGARNPNMNPETDLYVNQWVANPCTGTSYFLAPVATWTACAGSSGSNPCSWTDWHSTDAAGYYWRFLGDAQYAPITQQNWGNWTTSVFFQHPDGQYRRIYNVQVTRQ